MPQYPAHPLGFHLRTGCGCGVREKDRQTADITADGVHGGVTSELTTKTVGTYNYDTTLTVDGDGLGSTGKKFTAPAVSVCHRGSPASDDSGAQRGSAHPHRPARGRHPRPTGTARDRLKPAVAPPFSTT